MPCLWNINIRFGGFWMGDGCDDKKTHLVECVVYSTALFRKEECIRKNTLGQNLTSDSQWSAMSAVIAEGHQEVPRCLSDYITGRSWSIFFYWFCHLPLLRICSSLCTLVWSIHMLLTILCPNFVKAAILLFIQCTTSPCNQGAWGILRLELTH